MLNNVENISAYGVYDRFDIIQDFSSGVNIIFGDNGSGKTTLLHILSNVLNGDFERFAFIKFKYIKVRFNNGFDVELRRISSDDFYAGSGYPEEIIKVESNDGQLSEIIQVLEVQRSDPALSSEPLSKSIRFFNHDFKPLLSSLYFPAFRITIDAWKSEIIRENQIISKQEIDDLTTIYIRRWLTPFVPYISFPSNIEIGQQIVEESRSSKIIEKYLESVNSILDSKEIILNIDTSKPPIEVKFQDGYSSKGFVSLSSGENQIVSLIYASTRISKEHVVLVDEPEISLHVDWQRQLIRKMREQARDCQIIVCTHSPMIGADFEDQVSELNIEPFRGNLSSSFDMEIPY